ncbi:DNA repair protein [Aliarcobacter cryaerophilus]|uniref:DNA repair protein n=1 Tax=Aliarcobacter cryaerophilus TaxID=28198 RepID=A0A2S9SP35_9BACT|nr:DNA repair protein [Aliarcobacter cryaerophilus]PRM88279.1 DNA repair protein [Aliarcobacter cryaerophilus]
MAFLWVSNKLRDTKDYMVDKIEDTSDYISAKGSKVFNAVTGKATFLEAEKLYKKIEEKYTIKNNAYKKKIFDIGKEIEEKVSNINYHKEDIYLNHFERFKNLGDKLHNISINGKHFLEYFDDSIIRINNQNGIRNKKEIYKIDFNNLKFTEIAFGILTLGFYSRKKAKETLEAVEEEEIRVNADIEEMDSQIVKAQKILDSIDNVSEYFTELIKNYSKILDRFEYGIKSQIQKNILKGNKLDNGKLNFRMMPIIHIQEFQALFNLSIVLYQMASLGYLSDAGEIKDEDIKSIKQVINLVRNSEFVAA